jgi:V8-like Glu-specific endopeptidase
MIRLEGPLRRQLIDFLVKLDILQTAEGCRSILRNAGLGILIPKINLSGSSQAIIGHIVDFLAQWGSLEEQETLLLFLFALLDEAGNEGQHVLQTFINSISAKRIAISAISEIKGSTPPSQVLEKLIGEPSLFPICFLEQALELAHPVAYIETESALGTGFMISPSLLITNQHVLPDRAQLPHTVFRFNYQQTIRGEIGPVHTYHAKEKGLFYANLSQDYAILELDQSPGENWGYLPLNPNGTIHKDERVNIIQHPDGRPKQITFRNNFVEYVDECVIQYITQTEPGSSGSPVFNDHWELVALHHAGGNLLEPATQRMYYRNEGILIRTIVESLPSEVKSILKI